MTESIDLRRELIEAGRYMMANNLTWGSSGNLSARIGPESCWITASGTHLGSLEEEDIVVCTWEANAPTPTGRKPSREVPMHRAFYQTRPEIGAVLHASPFYSTLIACSDIDLPNDLFVESIYYLERVERVPYCHPGSLELGEAVREKCAGANIILMENHGVLVADVSVREALAALHTLETVCRMVITAQSADIGLNHLPRKVVNEFLGNGIYRPPRKWAA